MFTFGPNANFLPFFSMEESLDILLIRGILTANCDSCMRLLPWHFWWNRQEEPQQPELDRFSMFCQQTSTPVFHASVSAFRASILFVVHHCSPTLTINLMSSSGESRRCSRVPKLLQHAEPRGIMRLGGGRRCRGN